jgi:glycosyltransferase involved in cell wall biosynthesis
MKSGSRISVYITSYNQKGFLVEAIESVINQTILPFEIIIVDDASIDGSQELILNYKNKYPNIIKTIFHSTNIGISRSRNDAIKAAEGDYITYLDGDDYFLPSKIEDDYFAITTNEDADLVFANYLNMIRKGLFFPWKTDEVINIDKIFIDTFSFNLPQRMHFRNELLKKTTLEKSGLYDEKLKLWEDLDFRIRFTKISKIVSIEKINSVYRRHEEGLGTQSAAEHAKALLYIYNKNKKLLKDLSYKTRIKNKRMFYRFLANLYFNEGIAIIKKGKGSLNEDKIGLINLFRGIKFQINYNSFVLMVLLIVPYRVLLKLKLIK